MKREARTRTRGPKAPLTRQLERPPPERPILSPQIRWRCLSDHPFRRTRQPCFCDDDTLTPRSTSGTKVAGLRVTGGVFVSADMSGVPRRRIPESCPLRVTSCTCTPPGVASLVLCRSNSSPAESSKSRNDGTGCVLPRTLCTPIIDVGRPSVPGLMPRRTAVQSLSRAWVEPRVSADQSGWIGYRSTVCTCRNDLVANMFGAESRSCVASSSVSRCARARFSRSSLLGRKGRSVLLRMSLLPSCAE